MDFKEKLSIEIGKQQSKIAKLRHDIKSAEIYLQAQIDTLNLFPKEDGSASNDDASLRTGSDPARVREILSAAGKPMHVMELLTKLGKDQNPANRATLSGTLGRYALKNKVFTKTAPNTFGLLSSPGKILAVVTIDPSTEDIPVSFGTAAADVPSTVDEDVPF
jgi:hypothetical protein